jgi:multimeric flavodoxin WrbA
MKPRDQFRVYAINGSSRTTASKTARRLESIVKGFPKEEVHAEIIHLSEESLDFCDGTQNPRRTEDIDKLLKRLERADGIIFGTPTYWFNMSARMKNLFDRLTVTEKNNEYTLEGIVGGFVATGDAKEDGAMIAISGMAATAIHLGMITFPYSMLYFRGARGPGWAEQEIKDFPRRMLKMMRFGRRQRKEGWI